MKSITIIMPIFKGESTVQKTLESLFAQGKKFGELIIINDASPDRSKEIVENYLQGKTEYQLIDHENNLGLAKSYNDGIAISKGQLIVTLHQDVILEENALEQLTEPFDSKDVVAAGHCSSVPLPVWKKFNFWQKCFFARFAGKDLFGINGQFDCFRKEALEKAGLFDSERFRTAGEDGDIIFKLSRLGKIVQTKARIIHLQNISPDFGPGDIVWKHKQHSEARGALLASGTIHGHAVIIRMFFREFLIFTLIIPLINVISLVIIVIYSFAYTGRVFFEEYKNPKIIILPLFNVYLLFVSFIYSLRGFIYGKQRI